MTDDWLKCKTLTDWLPHMTGEVKVELLLAMYILKHQFLQGPWSLVLLIQWVGYSHFIQFPDAADMQL